MQSASYKIIAIVSGLGMFLSTLDSGIMNLALMPLSQYFQVSAQTISLLIVIYTLILSLSILFFGILADYFGHLKCYRLGIIIFLSGSIFCALSNSFMLILMARLIQGLGASLIQATALALIVTNLSSEDKIKAMGIFTACISLGPLMGPGLGGIILSIFNWRFLFWLNLPICLIALILMKKIKDNKFRASKLSINFKFVLRGEIIISLIGIFTFGGATAIVFLLPAYFYLSILHEKTYIAGFLVLMTPLGSLISAKFFVLLKRYYTLKKLMIIGLTLMSLVLLLLLFINKNLSNIFILSFLFLYGFSGGLFQSSSYLYLSQQVAAIKQAKLSAVIRLVQNLGIALMSYLALSLLNQTNLINGIKEGFFIAFIFVLFSLFAILLYNKKFREPLNVI